MVAVLHSLANRASDIARMFGYSAGRAAGPSSALEPCASCGDETAIGSTLFSERLRINEAGQADAFVCGPCDANIRASGKQARGMTPKELASFNKNASAAMITWGSRY